MVCSGHEVILNALRDHDPERAGKAMLQHIEEVENGMLNCKNGNMVLTQDGCLIDVRNGLH
jgi:DNA-binding FadR family transcriptional regulator